MKLVVDHLWTTVVGAPETLLERIDRETRYLVPGAWFSPKFRKKQWDGLKHLLDKRRKRFPTGLLEKVTGKLDEQGWEYTLEDTRDFELRGPTNYQLYADDGSETIQLRPYQREAVDHALMKTRGVIVLPTGSGKTEVAAALIRNVNAPTLFITHRLPLLHQTQARLEKRLRRKVGIVGDDQTVIHPVTVAMVQTLAHSDTREELGAFLETVKLLICDEVHHLGSAGEQWYENVAKVNAPYRFGLTATPDFAGHGLKLLAQTGLPIYQLQTRQLIDWGFLVPPRIWLHEMHGKVEGGYTDAYRYGIVFNQTRNEAVVDSCQTLARDKKSTLVLVRQIQHGELLTDLLGNKKLSAEFISGKMDFGTRDKHLSALRDGKLDTIIAQVETMAEGVDLPWLKALVNAVGSKGGGDASADKDGETGRQTIQILGRALRPASGKTFCDVVDFLDYCHPTLAKASESRIGTYTAEGHEAGIKYWHDYVS